jgi:hypothetical protein
MVINVPEPAVPGVGDALTATPEAVTEVPGGDSRFRSGLETIDGIMRVAPSRRVSSPLGAMRMPNTALQPGRLQATGRLPETVLAPQQQQSE